MNWNITQLDVVPAEGDLENVVVTAHWTLEGEQDGYKASTYSSVTFPAPSDDFTPYEDLTQEQVLGWVWENGVDKDQQEAIVQARIDAQINPPIVTPPLPWQEAEPQTEE